MIAALAESVAEALRMDIDPELGCNIVDIDLAYGLEVDDGRVRILLSTTTLGCPPTGFIRQAIESCAAVVPASGRSRSDDLAAALVAGPHQRRDEGAFRRLGLNLTEPSDRLRRSTASTRARQRSAIEDHEQTEGAAPRGPGQAYRECHLLAGERRQNA
jgi:hypothetical protein